MGQKYNWTQNKERNKNQKSKTEQTQTNNAQTKKSYQTTPSMNGTGGQHQWIQAVAFPLHRDIASLWKRWQDESCGGTPKCWPMRQPMPDIVLLVASLNPPSDSMARRIKDMPAAWQAGPWIASFLFSATSKAWPWLLAADCIVDCCIVERTVISRANRGYTSVLGTWDEGGYFPARC